MSKPKILKNLFKIILIAVAVVIVPILLLEVFVFRTYLDKQPEIRNFRQSNFDFSSSKPFYFEVNDELFFSADGIFSGDLPNIWKGKIEEIYVSPNGKYALIYQDSKLILIDNTGKLLFNIDNCTPLIPTEEVRKTGRFISAGIQWDPTSKFFLILQDKNWERNFSKKNRSSIYKYTVADRSFKPLIDLSEEVYDCFFQSLDEKSIYYEFATKKGDLAIKKIDLSHSEILSKHFRNDSLRLEGINPDSIYINFNKDQFDQNSFDLKSIVTEAETETGAALYYKNKDTLVNFLSGTWGYNAFQGNHPDFFEGGYFLPGNKFFIANISTKSFVEQIVIDTKTFRIMKLKKPTKFYFNINSTECRDFVFREEIDPNIKFSSSVSLEIEGIK
jgi:hypothetical protein